MPHLGDQDFSGDHSLLHLGMAHFCFTNWAAVPFLFPSRFLWEAHLLPCLMHEKVDGFTRCLCLLPVLQLSLLPVSFSLLMGERTWRPASLSLHTAVTDGLFGPSIRAFQRKHFYLALVLALLKTPLPHSVAGQKRVLAFCEPGTQIVRHYSIHLQKGWKKEKAMKSHASLTIGRDRTCLHPEPTKG